MSTVLAVLCHPDSRSLNHAAAKAVCSRLEQDGHSIRLHDLYAEKFDPVLSLVELRRRFSFEDLVQRHYRDLEESNGLLFFHPDWWSQPPALLKGWIDRVLRPGIGYEFEGEEFMVKDKVPLLAGKKALILATTDSAPPSAGNQPLLSLLWRETLGYCGMKDVEVRLLHSVREIDPTDRREWIDARAEEAVRFFAQS